MMTWSAEEVRAFLDFIRDDRLYPMIVLAVGTGMRRGERLGLRWADVDLDAGRVSVRRTVISIGYKVVESEPKTQRSRRSIDLDRQTGAVLREHRKRQLEERVRWGPGFEDHDIVFSRENGSFLHPDRVRAASRLVRESGIRRIRFHDLRHTSASLALAAGIHPKVVQERLGHSSIAITLDTYSHVSVGLQRDAADRIAALVLA